MILWTYYITTLKCIEVTLYTSWDIKINFCVLLAIEKTTYKNYATFIWKFKYYCH